MEFNWAFKGLRFMVKYCKPFVHISDDEKLCVRNMLRII
jgi:hypothetical protein